MCFNIFQAQVYHAAAHSNDPYVCSYKISIWQFICYIKHYTHYFSFSCQSDITPKFHILTMIALVDSQSLCIMSLCSTPVPNLHAMLLWFITYHHQSKSYQAELLPWPCQLYLTFCKNITPKSCTLSETLLWYIHSFIHLLCVLLIHTRLINL